jgi:cob(I)alamin adenosyltransferase
MSKSNSAKKILNVSTKTGDGGESGLITGERLPKNHPVFNVVGTLDELNSWLGVLVVKLREQAEFAIHVERMQEIQEALFFVGAECAGSKQVKLEPSHLKKLEKWSSEMQNQLSGNWHNQFVLPGGSLIGAHADLARAVCRRCEREVVGLNQLFKVRPLVLHYLNRLSDYLYVLRCWVNHAEAYPERFFDSKRVSK